MINIECLAAFVAIIEERSFSRAAERLGVVQSVASKRLARLEDQLGARLVDRSSRTDICPTRVGDLFLDEAREALQLLETAERIGRNLARGRSGPLRIGFVFSAAMSGTVTRIFSAVRQGLPEIVLEPRLMETPQQLAALAQGKLDIGLVRPRPSYPAGCDVRLVHSEELVVCLGSAHPLVRETALVAAQLAPERFIVPQFHESVGLIDSIRDLARAGRFDMPQVVRTDDFVTACCLASAGDGIVLAPVSLANLGFAGLCFRPLADYHSSLQTVCVYRKDGPEEAWDCIEVAIGNC